MRSSLLLKNRGWTGSAVLLGTLALTAGSLVAWKHASVRKADAAAARQPEPIESVTLAVARERQYRPTTTSVGTILALNSITLRNELAGTVRQVALAPGQIVEPGAVLVALDVSVEEAELQAEPVRQVALAPGQIVETGAVLVALDVSVEEAELQAEQAQADLAATSLARLEVLREAQATSQEEVDQARAARDVALAQLARTRAIIAKKTIRAPFRARVGISDVHPGQYLNEGTELTTLQGVETAANVDFTVAQAVAAELHPGEPVAVFATDDLRPLAARIVHSGERPAQGARRRPRLPGRGRLGRPQPRACAAGAERAGARGRGRDSEWSHPRPAGRHLGVLQAARGCAGRGRFT